MVAMQQDLFDLGVPDFSATKWTVKEITHETAGNWIPKYHYSGTIGAPNSRFFGLFAPDMVCVVGCGFSANTAGLVSRFMLERWNGNKEIVRVAAHPTAPFNTPSKSVSMVCRLLRASGLEWVFSYADTGQNHHGGIYQALNAIYVGVSPANQGYILDGEPVHGRRIVHMFGTRGVESPQLAAERGMKLEIIPDMNAEKHTYILPIGSPSVNRAIRKTLKKFAKPYPKRD